MRVFTDDLIKKIGDRHERVPGARPHLYHVATSGDDHYRSIRDEVEEWVADLPEETRSAVVPRLQSSDTHIKTYNQLAVGAALKRLGYEVEYEKPFDARGMGLELMHEKDFGVLVPDWYTHAKGGIPPMLIQVFVAALADSSVTELRLINDLRLRLREIEEDVVISVRFEDALLLSQRTNQRLAEMVQDWLAGEMPPEGAHKKWEGLVITVLHRGLGYKSVQFIGAAPGFWVDKKSVRMREALQAKMRRYKRLAYFLKMPLVIAVIADLQTGVKLDDFWDALFAQDEETHSLWRDGVHMVEDTLTKIADGLMHKKGSGLSAALWVWKRLGEWELESAFNPKAEHPLPEGAFTRD